MTDAPEENEIMAAAREAKAHKDAAATTPDPGKLSNWGIAAIGVAGIGSAALTAALLYANREKGGKARRKG